MSEKWTGQHRSREVVRALFLNALKDPFLRSAIEQILRSEPKKLRKGVSVWDMPS